MALVNPSYYSSSEFSNGPRLQTKNIKNPTKKGPRIFLAERSALNTKFGEGEVSIALLRHAKPVELVEQLDGEMEVQVDEDKQKVPH